MVTRGWNGYRNKSQHRKSTLEKKILPPFQQGFEPETFQSRVRCSNHRAIPTPLSTVMSLSLNEDSELHHQLAHCFLLTCFGSLWQRALHAVIIVLPLASCSSLYHCCFASGIMSIIVTSWFCFWYHVRHCNIVLPVASCPSL